MWDFVQGAGTDARDTSLRCKIDQKYWLSTELIPPYDLAVYPTSNTPFSYWPNCSGPVTRYLETTGERPDIGILPSWYVRHFLTQGGCRRTGRACDQFGGRAFFRRSGKFSHKNDPERQ